MSKAMLALAALATSEATGVTDISSLGPSDDDSNSNPGGGSAAPTVDLSGIGEALGELAEATNNPAPPAREPAREPLVQQAREQVVEQAREEVVEQARDDLENQARETVDAARDRGREHLRAASSGSTPTSSDDDSMFEQAGKKAGRAPVDALGGVAEGMTDEFFSEAREAWDRGRDRGDRYAESINQAVWNQSGDPILDGVEEGSRIDEAADKLRDLGGGLL